MTNVCYNVAVHAIQAYFLQIIQLANASIVGRARASGSCILIEEKEMYKHNYGVEVY